MPASLIFWDVQHGNACYVQTPTGKRLVIDCGVGSYLKPVDATFSPLKHIWSVWNVRTLDAAIVTHPHHDHIEDMRYLAAFTPKKVIAPRHLTTADITKGNRKEDLPSVQVYLNVLNSFSQSVPANQPDPLALANSGMYIFYYMPHTCATSNLNNHSIVTLIAYAGSKILIPGDNEAASWKELLAMPNFVQAIKGTNVLLAPHHGRDAGFSADLFNHISPSLIIISDGRYSDTSATSRYSAKATGLKVQRRTDKTWVVRKCVTTRSDDYIWMELGTNSMTKQNYIHVTID